MVYQPLTASWHETSIYMPLCIFISVGARKTSFDMEFHVHFRLCGFLGRKTAINLHKFTREVAKINFAMGRRKHRPNEGKKVLTDREFEATEKVAFPAEWGWSGLFDMCGNEPIYVFKHLKISWLQFLKKYIGIHTCLIT